MPEAPITDNMNYFEWPTSKEALDDLTGSNGLPIQLKSISVKQSGGRLRGI